MKNSSDNDVFLKLSLVTKFLFVPDTEIFRRVRRDSVSSSHSASSLNCDKLRGLERFYRLYGRKYISDAQARRRLGFVCKETAQRFYDFGATTAAACLFKKAISYDPLNFRAYKGLLKAVIKKAGKDTMPEWRMPEPLGDTVCNNRIA
jgi:hypothetical protein